ncbi:bifunctional fucokinase/fucose pyrophosphorylase [Phoenix dactylifera]|uniref:Bifunctional fucokinase/fucose pyrophosphorylase n=1 Tax=Phoenix dactylifera TaxID=42345 RepID=A0A8B9A327_PHODC|nr:bifunctional fucokinase/fucose pyrophosphorylase [Phoenix dactylifera]
MERRRWERRRCHRAEHLAAVLRKSWYRLRLSVRDPARVPTWDAIVLTAASPEQAALYDWQLRRAKRMGRIAPSTITLAVPDPDGARIGSGAATLHAISTLARHLLHEVPNDNRGSLPSSVNGQSSDDSSFTSMVNLMAKRHILLLHAGGDSKRVPWANPMGKVFLPLPYLAADNPDGPVPLLFDHILAISSCARQAFENEGGIFIMTGDVLPCFDASSMILPDNACCIITVPITLDIATNHGVVVAAKEGIVSEKYSLCLVDNLLQKPTMEELLKGQAIQHDGRALLDTGIIAMRGKAWVELVKLACSSSQTMMLELINSRKEMSLYEDLVAAFVPAKHEWLKLHPLGKELTSALGSQKMFSFCAYDLSFLHFGTSIEVLDHLGGSNSGLVGRRHLCSIPETTVCDIAASAVILSSKISPGVSIGEDSLVYDSSLSGRVQIGSQSIVVGVNIDGLSEFERTGNSFWFLLPDRHCLWQVPLVGCMGRINIYCGLQDNPKNSIEKGGTFCGKPWRKVLHDLKIQETDLWGFSATQEKCLWNAKLFPILSPSEMLNLGMWLMGSTNNNCENLLFTWRTSNRVSLEELHRSIDFPQMCIGSSNHQADLAAGIARACINYGLLGRNLSQLCEEILQKDILGLEICKEFLALCASLQDQNHGVLPQSRAYQVQVDLLRACGDDPAACMVEQKVWDAVASETASAVNYGTADHVVGSTGGLITSSKLSKSLEGVPFQPKRASVELPVRVDFVGGWSDTPPWSLERSGCVLNMAINLEGSLPIRTVIETTENFGILIEDDAGNHVYTENPISISPPFNKEDPFRLVKSALHVSGIIYHKILSNSGLRIRTWANVPRGSGLGTSSILAAAVVKGLLHLMEEDESNENVARIVLVLEQIMGTGGGWQDQIGGLYPGIKCTYSFPGEPLRLQVIPLVASPKLVMELEQRLLVVFSGQVRLAHQVLQKVVARYLRRDNLLISSIKRLVELSKIGREALMNGEIDELGDIMLEAWRLHQELDPFCSNEFVDKLFAFAEPYCSGYKLVGAGGGGFALLLAKDRHCAQELAQALENSSDLDVKVYKWSINLS